MTYFDLMSHPGYMEEFIRAKFLPHTDLGLFPSVQGQGREPVGANNYSPVPGPIGPIGPKSKEL
jgi:hypothetical protein